MLTGTAARHGGADEFIGAADAEGLRSAVYAGPVRCCAGANVGCARTRTAVKPVGARGGRTGRPCGARAGSAAGIAGPGVVAPCEARGAAGGIAAAAEGPCVAGGTGSVEGCGGGVADVLSRVAGQPVGARDGPTGGPCAVRAGGAGGTAGKGGVGPCGAWRAGGGASSGPGSLAAGRVDAGRRLVLARGAIGRGVDDVQADVI